MAPAPRLGHRAILQPMLDLEALLAAARAAGPGERIEFRDRIAAVGSGAIPSLRDWLSEPRLGAFAVRVLEKIAGDPASRPSVVNALASVDARAVASPVARDISDAVGRLRGHRALSGVGARPSPRASGGPWPGTRTVSALELRFHDDMLDIFRLAGEATRRSRPDGTVARGYWASYFLRGVRNHGGLEYAHLLLEQEGTTDGFQRLTDESRLDLTMEALVLKPEYADLFTGAERRIAAHRLAQAGYQRLRGT
jgi:hypothetical protein